MTTLDDRDVDELATCIHEAAHLVAARARAVPVHFVSIDGVESARGVTLLSRGCLTTRSRRRVLRTIEVLLAGPCAERRVLGGVENRAGVACDRAMARVLARRVTRNAQETVALLARLEFRAARAVDRYWEIICILAGALGEARELDAGQIELFWQHPWHDDSPTFDAQLRAIDFGTNWSQTDDRIGRTASPFASCADAAVMRNRIREVSLSSAPSWIILGSTAIDSFM